MYIQNFPAPAKKKPGRMVLKFTRMMGDVEHKWAVRLHVVHDQRLCCIQRLLIETSERFVEKKNCRLDGDRPGNGNTASHSTGKGARPVVRRMGETKLAQDIKGRLLGLGVCISLVKKRNGDVFPGAPPWKEAGMLGNKADTHVSLTYDPPSRRIEETRRHPQQTCLPRPAGAGDSHILRRAYVETEGAQDAVSAKRQGCRFEVEHGCHGVFHLYTLLRTGPSRANSATKPRINVTKTHAVI